MKYLKEFLLLCIFAILLGAIFTDSKAFAPAFTPDQCVRLNPSTEPCSGGEAYILQSEALSPTDFRYYVINLNRSCRKPHFYVDESNIMGKIPCKRTLKL